jgi:protein SCO1/2
MVLRPPVRTAPPVRPVGCGAWSRRLAFVLLGLGLCLALLGCSPRSDAPVFQGSDITGASYGQKLDLPDAQGRLRTLADFKGKAVVLFFGFTQCPDVCPTTLTDLVKAKKLLGPLASKTQVVFVSLDPARDTPEILSMYGASFDPSIVMLRGNEEQTAAVAKEFKIFFTKVAGRTQGSYTIDHSAGLYLLDTEGRMRVFVRHGASPEAIAADLKALLRP